MGQKYVVLNQREDMAVYKKTLYLNDPFCYEQLLIELAISSAIQP